MIAEKGWSRYRKHTVELKLNVTRRMTDRIRLLGFRRMSQCNVFIRQAIDEKLSREGR